MTPLFLDTGYLIALEAADDQHHQAAQRHWDALRPTLPALVTTTYVFDEVVTYFNSRGRHAKAVQVGERLLRSPSVEVVQVDPALFEAGWDYFQQRPDKRYSLTDCISFVLMHQRALQQALAFDRHFARAGFQMLPGELDD